MKIFILRSILCNWELNLDEYFNSYLKRKSYGMLGLIIL